MKHRIVLVLFATVALAALIAAAQTSAEEKDTKAQSSTSTSASATTDSEAKGDATSQAEDKPSNSQDAPKEAPEAPKKQEIPTLTIAGHKYQQTEWHSGVASWYAYGQETAWCNGRWSEQRWDFDNNCWTSDPRVKLWHFEWMGYANWHRFNTYKNDVPTVAHRQHELGTFVIFRYNGKEVIAMVTDRGPYNYNRDWDLNPCLRQKLGFDGVDTVEYNVLRKVD